MIPDPIVPAPAAPGMPVALRRGLIAVLVAVTTLLALALMVWTLSAGGFGGLDALLVACFALTLPWTVIGFWNAVIGLLLMRLTADPARVACPPLVDAADRSPITTRTALLSCIRNEDVRTVVRNLERMSDELAGRGPAISGAARQGEPVAGFAHLPVGHDRYSFQTHSLSCKSTWMAVFVKTDSSRTVAVLQPRPGIQNLRPDR